eukprot:1714476-Pyramimonas_sp.AAC.1
MRQEVPAARAQQLPRRQLRRGPSRAGASRAARRTAGCTLCICSFTRPGSRYLATEASDLQRPRSFALARARSLRASSTDGPECLSWRSCG